MKFNTFDEVARWYDLTKPVREKRHMYARDVRPIGERRYKDQRIVRISADCYVLSDGWHFGDPLSSRYDYGANYTPKPADMIRFAPIVWRREADGVETITVRNGGLGDNTVTSRHMFLRRHLPIGIQLRSISRTGRHTLRTAHGETFFPTGTAVPKVLYDVATTKKTPWTAKFTLTDDATVVFRREGTAFVLLSEPLPVPVPVVDREAKAPYAAAAREFRDWVLTVAPMLDFSWQPCRDATTAFNAWVDAEFGRGRSNETRAIRAVMRDPDHPQRVNLLYVIVGDCIDRGSDTLTSDHRAQLKARLTRHINKRCGFITTKPKHMQGA